MIYGLFELPWWGYLIVLFVLTQITIFSVTLYLHRCQAHRAVDFHPIISHFFRFWLWMTTGMVTKEWAAIHRKHHAKVETEDDPHSPQVRGLKKVVLEGAELYRKEARIKETMERYGEGTPDDWMERNIYTKHSAAGITIMLAIDILCFGVLGLTIWAVQMAWIPFFAAGVVNGVGHFWGYRNFESQDASRNILPLGIFIGGEELHNNHHTYATSAKFSVKWWEVDLGWYVIRMLQVFGLAKAKRVPPKPALSPDKNSVDEDTLRAIFTNRFQVMANYSKNVILPVVREERRKASTAGKILLAKARCLLVRDASLIKNKKDKQQKLTQLLSQFKSLNVVYQFRIKLQNIWAQSTASQKELVEALQEWCKQAEATGMIVLRDFVKHLKMYVPQQVNA